jgi:UPF0271 protein
MTSNPPPIDLNCDTGEGLGNDDELLRHVSSASIACGFHAGDPGTMRRTVRLAMKYGVAIGAHPGFHDPDNFGRREMEVTAEEVYNLVVYQIGALMGFVQAEGGTMRHVKPHGALYNMAARQADLADAIASAVRDVDPSLVLFGLAGSELIRAGERAGLRVANEAFADRRYRSDGSLVPRSVPNAIITDPAEAAEQIIGIVRDRNVKTVEGIEIEIIAETFCVHGDTSRAAVFAGQVRGRLEEEGVVIVRLSEIHR